MRVEITKAEARAKLAPLVDQICGAHYHHSDGRRCSIGWLFSEEEAHQLEQAVRYRLAWELIEDGVLVVDDPEWFEDLQRMTDLKPDRELFLRCLASDAPVATYRTAFS